MRSSNNGVGVGRSATPNTSRSPSRTPSSDSVDVDGSGGRPIRDSVQAPTTRRIRSPRSGSRPDPVLPQAPLVTRSCRRSPESTATPERPRAVPYQPGSTSPTPSPGTRPGRRRHAAPAHVGPGPMRWSVRLRRTVCSSLRDGCRRVSWISPDACSALSMPAPGHRASTPYDITPTLDRSSPPPRPARSSQAGTSSLTWASSSNDLSQDRRSETPEATINSSAPVRSANRSRYS